MQKPDIFLEATFANGEKIQWIFDAKYRIDQDKNGADCAPDDAINQMHRYRDALIHVHQADDHHAEKSRPILGAFVLYPGCFDEANNSNPYAEAIDAVGIGGFPLLPGQPNRWLYDFLTARFGNANMVYTVPEPDHYLVQDSARIATLGMYLGHYKDLTLVAPLGNLSGRDARYLQGFQRGTAGWYNMPLTTTDKQSVARNAMREVRYCAVAHGDAGNKNATHLYAVKTVKLVKRGELTIEQAGKTDSGNDARYWLFELGYAQTMPQVLAFPMLPHFKFLLTSGNDILHGKEWDKLPARYALLT
ncbi:MAG: nuclease domain-containing protein [Gallionella sp.]